MCLSVVVDRGRGSTTTFALEIMKDLFGVEGSLKILVVALNIVARVRIGYRDRLGGKKLKLRHGLIILRRILIESLTWHQAGFECLLAFQNCFIRGG